MEFQNTLALLRIRYDDGSERVLPITKSPFSIGRIETNDLQLVGDQVSRHHARLLFEGDRISLIDLNSRNGTRIKGAKLLPNQPYVLDYGVTFVISTHTLRLETVPTQSPKSGPSAESPVRQEASSPDAPSPPVPSPPPPTRPLPIAKMGAGAAPPPPSPPSQPPLSGNGQSSYENYFGVAPDRSRYLQYLPPIYEEHPFLSAFLLAFEGVLTPIEQTVDNFDLYLHPHTAPSFFLEQLATWLALTLDEKWPIEKRRAVLAEAAELYRRRGTRWSLSRYLEIYTGVPPQIVEPDDQPHLFSVVLRLPKNETIDPSMVRRIIEASKPAHTIYTLEIFQEK